jgi:hypothetical protein
MSHAIHLTEAQILDGLKDVRKSPKDKGSLEAIVIRPGSEERLSLQQCRLSPEGGTEDDAWARGCWLKLPDGRPHPDVQICIMNSRMSVTISIAPTSEDTWVIRNAVYRWLVARRGRAR